MSNPNQPPLPAPDSIVTVKGTVNSIVFNNPHNSYTVARFIEDDTGHQFTIVGTVAQLVPGQHAVVSGKWEYNPRFGPQLHISAYNECRPSTTEGIERFLGSGMIEGIGAEMAKRIVAKFKEKTLDIIDSEPGRLNEIPGIGCKRLKMISNAWKKHYQTRHIMIALHEFGLPPALALRIYNTYKEKSLSVIEENPYRLAYEMRGIGFRKADEIALSAGRPADSPDRISAAVLYFLQDYQEEGDVYTPCVKLIDRIARELSLPVHVVEPVVNAMVQSNTIIMEKDYDNMPCYTKEMHEFESTVAGRIAGMARQTITDTIKITADKLYKISERLSIRMDDDLAVRLPELINHQLLVITGGPGTGKTTLVRLLLEVFAESKEKVLLGAPTGRAAKRLNETTGRDAMTIHRLLDYIPRLEQFQKNEFDPLDADTVIIDEVSMLDMFLMHHLLKAIRPGTRLILVGDADQLPSVGPGAILQNLVSIEKIPLIRLTAIYRQAQDSYIVINAHRINHGKKPVFPNNPESSDFFFIEKNEPAGILEIIKKVVAERIPGSFSFDPIRDIQVLSPMRKGLLGVESLNTTLQTLLNPSQDIIKYGDTTYKTGDKVMQIKNNYDLDIFNGDIGAITAVDDSAGQMSINFYGREISYERSWFDQISLAYAISVHKSQGSEYPAVVIPLTDQHFIMLQRNLLYTAVTRGKRLVVLVGTQSALERCLCNNQIRQRNSLLSERIKQHIIIR